jgi:hypothetical protein
MNAQIISKWSKQIPCFLGIYELKDLKYVNIVKNHVSFLVIHKEHAIGIYVDEKSVDIFDPLGVKNFLVYGPIYEFLAVHLPCKKLNLSLKLQSDKSIACAKFCLVFLMLRCQSYTFCEVINLFTIDTEKNEKKIEIFFNCLFQ